MNKKDIIPSMLVLMVLGYVLLKSLPITPLSPTIKPTIKPVKITKTLTVYGAEWCRYCKLAEPTVIDLENRGIKVIRVDADKQPELLRENSITLLPTFMCTIKRGAVTSFQKTQKIDEVLEFFK